MLPYIIKRVSSVDKDTQQKAVDGYRPVHAKALRAPPYQKYIDITGSHSLLEALLAPSFALQPPTIIDSDSLLQSQAPPFEHHLRYGPR